MSTLNVIVMFHLKRGAIFNYPLGKSVAKLDKALSLELKLDQPLVTLYVAKLASGT